MKVYTSKKNITVNIQWNELKIKIFIIDTEYKCMAIHTKNWYMNIHVMKTKFKIYKCILEKLKINDIFLLIWFLVIEIVRKLM
jgi:hypothetical protein